MNAEPQVCSPRGPEVEQLSPRPVSWQNLGRLSAFSLRQSPRWGWALAILALSACSSQPTVRIQYVNVPTYLPMPATLTAPVAVDLGATPTWGSALGAYSAGLQTCNGKLSSLAILKPPPTPRPF